MLDKKIRYFTLKNAFEHNGTASVNSVLGKVISSEKIKKEKIKEIRKKIEDVVEKVNSLSGFQIEEELKKFKFKEEKKERKREIELEGAKKGNVIMRFAPNPNGAMTFGHARTALWNWFFCEKYNGKFILRFDDTDPRIKVPLKEAYDWFKEDLHWLGVKPSKPVIQSKRLDVYYKYAEKLIKKGYAYVDTLPADKMRKMIWERIISDERQESPDLVMKKWKKMFTKYKEGEAVLRIKTDIMNANPAIRDWVGFRIIKNGKHPLIKAKVWPLLNFASAIDDHELGITHILRGADLEISDERQKYIYEYFGWEYPKTSYNGKFLVAGIKSTSEAKELIDEGKLSGWDDPRLGTLKALRKRGIQKEAIVNWIKDNGIGKNDLHVNIESLYSYNKDIIDKKANRYFFIENPYKLKIKGSHGKEVKILLHPDFPKKGSRKFKVKDVFYVQDEIVWDQVYRFMYLFNFRNNKVISDVYDPKLKAKQLHWLPVSKNLVKVEVVMPDNSVKKGVGESGLKSVRVDEIIQFERFGFCRLDKKLKDKLVFYYGHN